MKKERLNFEDVRTIKKARAKDMKFSLYQALVFSIFLWISFRIYKENPNIEYWEYVFFILPVTLILSAFKDILMYRIDIYFGYKLVIFSECKRYTHTGDGTTTHHLSVTEYGDIDLIGYNYDKYFLFFSEQSKQYEIHLAPKSKIILYAKQIFENQYLARAHVASL